MRKDQEVGRSPAEAGSGHSPKGGARKRSPAKPSVPNAALAYDPARDGFDTARLLLVVSQLADVTARKSAQLAYGAWNPRFCSADAASDALAFFQYLTKRIDHYADQAAAAISAGTGESAAHKRSAEPEPFSMPAPPRLGGNISPVGWLRSIAGADRKIRANARADEGEAIADWIDEIAQAIEARRAETQGGSVYESAVPEGNAP